MFRIIITRMPKSIGNTITNSSNVNLFQLSQLRACGNAMILPIDHDKGIKPYYDRVHNITNQDPETFNGSITVSVKEKHTNIKITLHRKKANTIIFDSTTQNIVNVPLSMYIIPYDSYGTLVTDNITSYTYSMCMYYKDI